MIYSNKKSYHSRFITGVTSRCPISKIGSNAASKASKVSASHTMNNVCEADTFEALDAAFDPILEMGHLEVTPVMKRE